MVDSTPILSAVDDVSTAPCLKPFISTTLGLPPSCIEFVPYSKELFVVGTYNLESDNHQETLSLEGKEEEASFDSKPQSRSGSLSLYQLEGDDLSLTGSVPTNSAVLDLHFSPNAYVSNTEGRQFRLAVATSAGIIEIHSVISAADSNPKVKLDCLQIIQAYDPSLLILSLAFNPLASPSEVLAVTLSNGSVAVFDRSEAARVHTLEAWTVAWSSLTTDDGQMLYSGGDDSMFQAGLYSVQDADPTEPELLRAKSVCCVNMPECIKNNVRSANKPKTIDANALNATWSTPGITPARAILKPKSFRGRIHGAGVTAILPINLGSEGKPQTEVLLTGSYDDFVRVISPNPSGKWTVLAEKGLDGGVWRLKHLSQMATSARQLSRHSVLASCMHAGARVVEVSHDVEDAWSIGIFARLEEHESMNYASDFVKRMDDILGREMTTVVSTSFYDKKLCITRIPDLA